MLLVVGISETARFNNVIVFIKLAVVFLLIGFGFVYINRANWQPVHPARGRPGQVRMETASCAARE